jgi:hypothetical protein
LARLPRVNGSTQLRGLKGLWWEPEQYLGWPALLAEAGYNFLMLCYTFSPSTSLTWRRQFGERERRVIGQLVAECARHDLELCLALHPFIGAQSWRPDRAAVPFHPTSGTAWFQRYWRNRGVEDLEPDPALRYGSAPDLELLAAKCAQALRWGIRTFALCLDDIEAETSPVGFSGLAEAQLWLVAALHERLLALDPKVRLLLVPTYYWTAGAVAHPEYTAVLARQLPAEIELFWTGPAVRSHQLTAADARKAAALFGRKPIVWLNYASNDSFRFALQLPPAHPPSADLLPETAGLLVNPMRQVALTRLHALVMGEYLRERRGFDHLAAIQHACERLVGPVAAPQLERLLEAWSAYPDPRTLPAELAQTDRDTLRRLHDRLSRCQREVEQTLAGLRERAVEPAMLGELTAGGRRLELLVEALSVVQAEPERGSPGDGVARERLLQRLVETDDETAADAQAVLLSASLAGRR